MLQISISTPQCFAYSPQHRRASCCLKLCSDAESQPAHFGCALSVLKAAKEAGQALVGKAPHPPFESQHHHLLHCLEKTTVKKKKNSFFLKHKSCVRWKTHQYFGIFHSYYFSNRLYTAHSEKQLLLCKIASLLQPALYHEQCQLVTVRYK